MFKLNFFLFFFIFLNASYSQVVQDEIKAKIEIKYVEGNTILTGTAENNSDVLKSASYKLTVIKKNKISNNQTNNAQEGMVTLNPGEFKKLSSTQINIESGDEIIVMLVFFDEKKQIISKDRVVLGEQKKKDEIKIPIDGFELRGVVLNETKTRIGQDFYDRYYYKYNEIGVNAKKIVVISEEFTFARNTKILISIDNSVVYEFLARPDDEYLESVAQESVEGTYHFFKELEKQSKYFIQY